MFNLFNSKKRLFKNNLIKLARAHQSLLNPVFTSIVNLEKSEVQIKEIKIWWEQNVESYKASNSISHKDFEHMRVLLNLPDIGKFKNINGTVKEYYQNGQLEYEWHYNNGYKDGIQKGWHENGVLSFEHRYLNDYMEGKQKSWYDNGNISSVNNYRFSGENRNLLSDEIGWQREYYENGKLKLEKYYDEISFKSTKYISYFEDGTVKENKEFTN